MMMLKDEIQNETFSHPSQKDVPSVTIAFDVYAPCRDTFFKNDQSYYWSELEQFSEIEKIEHLYVHSRSGFKVGTYLETYIKMTAKYADDSRMKKYADKQFGTDFKSRRLALNKG